MCLSIARYIFIPTVVSVIVFTPGCSEDPVIPAPEPKPKTPSLVVAIAYHDETNRDLKYVEKTGEVWKRPEIVHYTGDQGRYLSLAVDAHGKPHISYHCNGPDDLMYAVRRDDGWQRFLVDAVGVTGANTSIAIDALGNPHISYRDNSTDKVKYASYISDENWNIEVLQGWDVTGVLMPCGRDDYGFPIPLVIDANGTAHLCYCTSTDTNRNLAYATKPANGSWSYELVDETEYVGYCSSIALDAQGNPHISYEDRDSRQIKYARKMGGSNWNTEPLPSDPPSECRYKTSIAVDANGAPHICYFNDQHHLQYAVKTATSGWINEVVDNNEDVGRYCSLALDNQGIPYISYWDRSNGYLKCAVRSGDGWTLSIVDDAATVGKYTSIAICYR